jgi:hypothetical protein
MQQDAEYADDQYICLKDLSSGIQRHVRRSKSTDFSEKHVASIFVIEE